MKSTSTNQMLAALNIFLIIFILVDCYVLPPIITNEKIAYTDIRTEHTKGSRFVVEITHTTSGKKINWPDDFFLPLKIGTDLVVWETAILKRNLFFEFDYENDHYKVPVGLLNDGGMSYWILFSFCFLISINFLFKVPPIKINEKYFFIPTTVLYLVLTFIYFINY